MGISPIEYRPWEGKRTGYYNRLFAISRTILTFKLKSKWILALIIIGSVLVHVFPILFNTMIPHEELTPELMVGEDPDAGFDAPGDGRPDTVEGYFLTSWEGLDIQGPVGTDGYMFINGSLGVSGAFELMGNVTGAGLISSDGQRTLTGVIQGQGMVVINGTLVLNGTLGIFGSAWGDAVGEGNFTAMGEGVLAGARLAGEDGDLPRIRERAGGYLKNALFIIFTILIAALVCSDLIAEDIGSNSFILYFSRPVKPIDYVVGKLLGAFLVMVIFCTVPPVIHSLAVMGTQSGPDYGLGLNVLGSTVGAGLLTAFVFLPYGLFISSMTKRKAYAAIGTFMSFFVLTIVGALYPLFGVNWVLADPSRILFFSYDVMFGYPVPEGIDPGLLGAALAALLVIPMAAVYVRIHLKAVGR